LLNYFFVKSKNTIKFAKMSWNSSSFPFEKLRGRENFDVWKRHAKSALLIKGCWYVIEKDVLEAKDSEADARALAEITLMIEPTNFSHIASAATAKDAWNGLLKAYEDKGITRKVELLRQLVNIKMVDYENIQEYVNELIMKCIKVKTAGLNFDDELTASLLLAGLPEEYKALVLAVENSHAKFQC